MIRININEKCNGCGICLMVTKYFFENIEGCAEVKKNIIEEQDLERLKDIVAKCPAKAIILEDDGIDVNNKGEAIKKVVRDLEKELDELKIPRVTARDMHFDIESFDFPYPDSPHEINSEYRSESSAKSAAKEDFNRLVYGESARNTLITKILVEQKVSTCSQYYTVEKDDRSFYYRMNQKVETILQEYVSTLNTLLGKDTFSIEKWTKIDCYPSKKSISYHWLNEYPHNSGGVEGIWKYVRDLGPTTLGDYVDYMEFDYFEEYIGSGIFGGMRTRKDWYFKRFYDATKEFYTDIKRGFKYESDNTERFLMGLVNSLIDDYEELLRKNLAEKIVEIKKGVSIMVSK